MSAFSATLAVSVGAEEQNGGGFNHFVLIVNKLDIKEAVRQLFSLTL
jgi:hypothetical protein